MVMGIIKPVAHLIQREPVAFQGCVQATLAALVGFGVIDWSSEQVGLMLAVVAAFLAMLTRAKVVPSNGMTRPGADGGDPHVGGGTLVRDSVESL
jgi:hypothetical protein